ncbi:hypothetical protein HS1genome_0871 [Sulfodiicoccus acidiphilus]|uniref:CopG family transcriptional regulator n=1 Tax=Sulfodiicoccus acidiphilus TaxID=1670455 RepID=A0A348B2T0_9CREN|nr:CopG family transcriptional regulator [Sulfodiicoccus acidiphilus]BBD72482.1 hypothetical protein HS1genome_0871 [Sulfodiicoccus acidiphilus]GGT96811.1 hypothetical protein GCM10007116_12880 [Sulfodiicoccus acidiphilus]
MKYLTLKLTEDEYKELEERARSEGYALVSDYVRTALFGRQEQTEKGVDINAISNAIAQRLERKLQDVLNPFTGKIDDLARRVTALEERVAGSEEQKPQKQQETRTQQQQRQEDQRKTAMDILKERGVLFESELRLRSPDAFFSKLDKEGAKIITTETERIAIDQEFLREFKEKLSTITTEDMEEAQKKLRPNEYKLFEKLKNYAVAIFDSTKHRWILLLE